MNLRNLFLLYYRRLELISKHDLVGVSQRIKAHVLDRQPWLRSPPPDVYFIGKNTDRSFTLIPVTKGINTYLPRLKIQLQAMDKGTHEILIQTLHPITVVIPLAFFAWLGYFGFEIAILAAVLVSFHIVIYFVGFLP